MALRPPNLPEQLIFLMVFFGDFVMPAEAGIHPADAEISQRDLGCSTGGFPPSRE
jgi:hypothetical protein